MHKYIQIDLLDDRSFCLHYLNGGGIASAGERRVNTSDKMGADFARERRMRWFLLDRNSVPIQPKI
jgi:hypothetical protein